MPRLRFSFGIFFEIDDNYSNFLVKLIVYCGEDHFCYDFACQIRQVIQCSVVMYKFFTKDTQNIISVSIHFLLFLRIEKIKNNLRELKN